MDKAIEQLVEAVKQASPALWAAAQHKVQADIAVDLMAIKIGIAMVVVGAIGLALALFLDLDFESATPLAIISFGLGAVGGIVTLMCVLELKALTTAPDWYAIKALTELSPLK